MEDRKNGSMIFSKMIILRNHVTGITANKVELTSPTVLPYHLSAILKIKYVSIIASIPIINLGISYSNLIDFSTNSTEGLMECG